MLNIFTRLLDLNAREVSRLSKIVEQINSFEKKTQKLKDSDFKKKTEEFKKRLSKGETLEEILPEAFALVREASFRTLGLKHHDVQLMASTALFEGKIVEQKTGEGKTLSAVPALYLRALTGEGVHLVTVNDYLARRDAGWNGPIFDLLGLTVGTIIQENKSFVYDPKFSDERHGDERLVHLKASSRKEAYLSDILYGTNNEFGFDYLRDNMVQDLAEMVQRGHYFAIVDEVDSVLIDEARTPLIISAPDTNPTKKYYEFAQIIDKLNADTDYQIDEKAKSASLTEHGISKVEKILGVDNLYEKDFESVHHIENALRAKSLYLKDKDYVVKDGSVTIVDEFTGRLMFGRRWSDGLHQAVEAKEGVVIQQESKTLATISFQNYFRMYDHLSGMTGTAATESEEFKKIYSLDVVSIPTHQGMIRIDNNDSIYKSLRSKYTAVADEIEKRYHKGQPVLVGTTSIEKNEVVSELLKRKKIPHQVLNAKNHEQEARVLSEAGKPKGVTVATNMAGRGVDIVLGGTKPKSKKELVEWEKKRKESLDAGGLFVIGTERHESRRIDNQLRGRSGRQGDPGESRFFLSMEDDLMRIFGGEQISGIMDRLNLPEDQPIENGLISRAIEQAQVKVEGFHFDTRKRLVEFDDVANQQREIIYKLRRRVLESTDLKDEILEKLKGQVERIADYESPQGALAEIIPFDDASIKRIDGQFKGLENRNEKLDFLTNILTDVYEKREKELGSATMRQIEKYAYLGSIDHLWMDHIDQIDDLREGVSLRGYGQRDPLVEFKGEAFNLFESLIERINEELARRIFRVGVAAPQFEIPQELMKENLDLSDKIGVVDPKAKAKIGRNDPCWCGSGKKFKKCHYPQLPK